jgi:UDP-N-acetylmuramate: L-alanyl-gamma-D-glutamyl-meso-diaminopimelate ligase
MALGRFALAGRGDEHEGGVCVLDATARGERLRSWLPMAGEHNALNATAAAALAAGQGVPVAAIVEALATFRA